VPSSSPNSWLGAAFSHVVKTMSSGRRQRQSEPTLDRGSEGRRPDNLTAYSPEQIISHATAAGRTAYAAVIRAGRTVALAECAYNRAYIRTIPPCWVALLDPPTPPRRVRQSNSQPLCPECGSSIAEEPGRRPVVRSHDPFAVERPVGRKGSDRQSAASDVRRSGRKSRDDNGYLR